MADPTKDDSRSLGDFYTACDAAHREFFSSVMHEWREAGLPWEWREENIVLYVRSAGRSLRLFMLHAGSASMPPYIQCDLRQVRVRLGDAEADSLLSRLRKTRGLELQGRDDVCRVLAPANASSTGKQALKAVLRRLGSHLPKALAP